MQQVGRFLGYSGHQINIVVTAAQDPFRKKELAAIVHHMFGIFHGDVLIGRSELESGDPPMAAGVWAV